MGKEPYFELGGSYTVEEIDEMEGVRSLFHDKEIDAYLAHGWDEAYFFDYWDTDERGRLYRYRGGYEKYQETFG